MEKMKMESIDGVQSNIEKIAELFPNCITEALDTEKSTPEKPAYKKAVNWKMLHQMLTHDLADENEAYEMTWVGKKAAIIEANKPIRKTLRPCPEESVNWDSTENLYIEGDNLDVLKLLQESYLGKVKMIYIDPPYNTGHDFVYPDSFKMDNEEYDLGVGYFDEDGNINFKYENNVLAGKFHSDWCSMIYSRLLVSKNLLKDDGFIAISIGEEEVENLKKICNEVFGEANFRNLISVRRYDKNLNLQFAGNGLSTMNVGLEYILVYSKNQNSKMTAVYRPATDDRASTGYWKGFWNNADRPTMRYPVLGVTPTEGQWKWQKSVADEAVDNYIEFEKNYADKMSLEEYWKKTGSTKRFIRRRASGTGKNLGVEHWVAPADGILRTSNWSDLLVSKPVGFDLKFDSPKNPDVIKELIKLFGVGSGDIILDYFSGSATTAEATMNLSSEDGVDRKFILVQIAEPCKEKSDAFKAGFSTICEIGKERIRRSGKSIQEENPKIDTGFRVFKIDTSNFKDVYYQPNSVTQATLFDLESNIKEDRSDSDLFYGCVLDWGLPLNLPYQQEIIGGFKVHNYNNGDLIACFEENVSEELVKEIASRQPMRAVFRDSSFGNSPEKINVFEIFKKYMPEDADDISKRVKVI